MEQHYAQALWEMIERGMEPKKAVQALYEYLKMHGREALMPRIGKAFQRLCEREKQRNVVTLSIAHEKDASLAKKEARAILEKIGADPSEIEIELDHTLIGGWRLEGMESLSDASFKKYLLDMYNAATI